jgi:hypothetical protein
MAFVIKDRVRETTTSTGTTAVTLAGAVTGYNTFASIGNGNNTYYTISSQNSTEWEVGVGTYTASGTTLSRDAVLANYLGTTALINFSAGNKDVFCTYPAEKASYVDPTQLIYGGDNGAIFLTAQTITTNAVVPSGYNGIVASTLTVANGGSITVPDGSVVIVVA